MTPQVIKSIGAPLTVEVKLTRGFICRVMFGMCLMRLGAKVMGCVNLRVLREV